MAPVLYLALLSIAAADGSGSCNVQDGQNNQGSNLKMISGVSDAGQCCNHCTSTDSCVGFTWVKSNHECWLKDKLGDNKGDSDVVSGSTSSPSPPPSPPSPPPSPTPSGDAFCPSGEQHLNTDYSSGGVSFTSSGWNIHGSGRVSSKAAFNLLGGYIEFDMDLSEAHSGVNQNLYVVSLNKENCGSGCYCDAPNGHCMELDFIEANGHCAYATTWHTTMVGGQNCGLGGCQHVGSASTTLHVKAEFAADGEMTVNVNNDKVDRSAVNPQPSDKDVAALKARMESHGVVVESSQWTGWVPQGSCGGDHNLGASIFKISNLRVKGIHMNGPVPPKCSGYNMTIAV